MKKTFKQNKTLSKNSKTPWERILEGFSLSKTERETLKRFSKDPMGRGFLSLADIFRKHHMRAEAIELLTEGMERHPEFTTARVILAKELFHMGNILDAQHVLEQSPESLEKNTLAQKIFFKIYMLLGRAQEAKDIFKHMQTGGMLDEETRKWGEKLFILPFKKLRQEFMDDLKQKGVSFYLPSGSEAKNDPDNNSDTDFDNESSFNRETFTKNAPADDPFLRDQIEKLAEDSSLNHFYVTTLEEVFDSSSQPLEHFEKNTPVEMDTVTLAEIYENQGHYSQAIQVYRRLLTLRPHSDQLKLKLRDLMKREREQKEEDLSIDPLIVDRMETVEYLDRQSDFYKSLLDKLERSQT